MKHLLLCSAVVAIFAAPCLGQRSMPVVRATTALVDITDNGVSKPGSWTIVPEAKPDVYATTVKGGRVTFRTDIDSISFTVQPGEQHDFIVLLGKDSAWTRVTYRRPYLETLKGAGAFDPADARSIPAFAYQAADAPPLVALRKAFNLDSIAGQGNEVSRILELMHWLHDLVPHDGEHENPVVKNALSMIAECKREHRGLNCRGLSTVLNECYLALGFRSRFLTCLPKDTLDTECHVINMVWSNDLKKWIWLDATHDAYVLDEQGTMLGPEEVRQRLINERPLILNPDANWNHRTSSLRENYLYDYMAKNLYRFECPILSQYDTESQGTNKTVDYIQLVPMDHHTQKPDVETQKGSGSGITYTTYRTNRADRFWAAP